MQGKIVKGGIAGAKNKTPKTHKCPACGYTSERQSNVTRHYGRIHEKLEKPKVCFCGEKFLTKMCAYQHIMEKHPDYKQSTHIIKNKYKIKSVKRLNTENTKYRLRTNKNLNYKETRLTKQDENEKNDGSDEDRNEGNISSILSSVFKNNFKEVASVEFLPSQYSLSMEEISQRNEISSLGQFYTADNIPSVGRFEEVENTNEVFEFDSESLREATEPEQYKNDGLHESVSNKITLNSSAHSIVGSNDELEIPQIYKDEYQKYLNNTNSIVTILEEIIGSSCDRENSPDLPETEDSNDLSDKENLTDTNFCDAENNNEELNNNISSVRNENIVKTERRVLTSSEGNTNVYTSLKVNFYKVINEKEIISYNHQALKHIDFDGHKFKL